jgi:predicted dehydrogenase
MDVVAVIGLGNIAKRHRANIRKMFPGCQIVAMPSSNRHVSEDVPDADIVVKNINELLAYTPELVIVASPATFHQQHALLFIGLNVPTIIEKPLSHCSLEAEQIVTATHECSSDIIVGYCLRFLPSTQVVRKLIDTGKIGKIYNVYAEVGQYLPDWRPSIDFRNSVSAKKSLGGGALLELSHELDYLAFLFGSEFQFKHAILRKSAELGLDVEDLVDVAFCFNEEVVCNLHMDFLQKMPQRFCRLIGSDGRIEWDLLENKVVSYTSEGECVEYNSPSWDKNEMYIALIDSLIKKDSLSGVSPATVVEASRIVSFVETIKNKAIWMS